MQVKKQQLEPDMEQRTGSKLGKECFRAVYCHAAYLTYMPSISWEIDGETVETVSDFIFLDSKITVDGDYSHEI